MLAMIGLVLLWLTPFSILKNMQIFFVAIVIVSMFRLFAKRPVNCGQLIDVGPLLELKKIRFFLLAVVLYALLGSFISILILLSSGDADIFELAWRFFSQFAALLIYMFTIVCGYHMAVHFDIYRIRQAIYIPFLLMVSICVYQVFSESWGLPYIGNYVVDKFVGLRPSGLAGEPKYLASYLAVVFFFLLYELKAGKSRFGQFGYFIKLSGLAAAAYFFLAAASGNGFLAFFVLLLVYFTRLRIWQQLVVGAAMVVILLWLGSQIAAGGLGLRGSHQDIIDNLGNLDLSNLDDLIALPLMAWRDNGWNLLFGFGPGLMHFFARRYMNFATWLTDETYIEGNVSAITFISNFGLVLFATLFVFFAKRSWFTINSQSKLGSFPVNSFFVSSFFVGALVGGNSSIPFFLSLGWILRWSVQRKSIKSVVQ
ncbi:MAG: hypothetical protein Q7T21_13615 [Gallionella sp.]|nr:hypothetical protein [Gallionella sp.]